MYPAQAVTALESRGLRIKWNEADDKETVFGYFVYISESETGTYRQDNRYAIQNKNEYITKELMAGRTYWVKLRVVDIHGNYTDTSPFKVAIR